MKGKQKQTICDGLFLFGSPCWAEGIFSHAYSRKYSRLSSLDALLTLGRLYSLFSQSPVEKQYLIVFLGRLPTSLSSVVVSA